MQYHFLTCIAKGIEKKRRTTPMYSGSSCMGCQQDHSPAQIPGFIAVFWLAVSRGLYKLLSVPIHNSYCFISSSDIQHLFSFYFASSTTHFVLWLVQKYKKPTVSTDQTRKDISYCFKNLLDAGSSILHTDLAKQALANHSITWWA